MNARLEGWIKFSGTVGRQEEDAFVVFEQTEENGDKGVSEEIVLRPFRQENVGLI